MADEYSTISTPGEGKITEKMSKFLAFAFHAEDVEEARQYIADVTRRYHDARHVCWAWRLGVDGDNCLSSDNGEPSGTAGRPILGQMVSKGVTNAVVIVVRYFGGIKLGTSGLIVAYREAARDALDNAVIKHCYAMNEISFTFPYLSMNDVMKLVKQNELDIVSQIFDNSCQMTLSVRRDDAEALRKRIADIDGVTLHD